MQSWTATFESNTFVCVLSFLDEDSTIVEKQLKVLVYGMYCVVIMGYTYCGLRYDLELH